jgi:hypothetical protein
MRWHHITTETFRSQGDDPAIPDCYVDPKDLAAVRMASGIDTLNIMGRVQQRQLEESGEALPDDVQKTVDDMRRLAGVSGQTDNDSGHESPLSTAGSAKGEYMRVHDIAPGSDAWFKLWFSRPGLTGEDPMPLDHKKK